MNRSDQIQQQNSNALTIARLTKAFASQVDALAKLRRGGEQRIVVEHVYIHAGGQAIVGAVTHTGRRGIIENQGQPHATTNAGPIVASDGNAMRSQQVLTPYRVGRVLRSGRHPIPLGTPCRLAP